MDKKYDCVIPFFIGVLVAVGLSAILSLIFIGCYSLYINTENLGVTL